MGSVKGREGERLRVEGIIGCGYGQVVYDGRLKKQQMEEGFFRVEEFEYIFRQREKIDWKREIGDIREWGRGSKYE